MAERLQGKISLNQLYDLLISAIIYLSKDEEIDKFKLQKGVFYFIWKYSNYKNIDFKLIADKLGIEPNKFGPYSENIDGLAEMLQKKGLISIKERNNSLLFKATESGLNYIDLSDMGAKNLLNDIHNLVGKLDPKTLVFFVYYNPYIPSDVKEYFTSKSEIKQEFENKKEQYVEKLKLADIIDDSAASLILSA